MTTTPHAAEPSFQAFQRAFTQHIRNPKVSPCPINVPAERMAIYTEIVYNNIEGTLSACFPVAKSVLNSKKWQQLIRGFMANYRSTTPIFREIPEQLLHYLALADVSALKLPEFLPSLMHYEWVELKVSVMNDNPSQHFINSTGHLLEHQPAFSPTLHLLDYEYEVHKISPQYKPKAKVETHLLVYRDATFSVKFIEINALTEELITLLMQETITTEQALNHIAGKLSQLSAASVLQYGLQILDDLKKQGVILGVITNQSGD